MLKFFRTDYGEKQPAAAVAANQMAGAGACVCRYRCVGLNHVVEAFTSGGSCSQPNGGRRGLRVSLSLCRSQSRG